MPFMQEQKEDTTRSHTFRSILVEYRAVIFNAIFLIYILILQKPLLGIIKASDFKKPYPLLGAILVAVVIAEFIGLHLKVPMILRRARKSKSAEIRGGCFMFLIWIFRMVINMFILILGIGALGIGPDAGKGQTLFIILMFVSVIKDLYAIFYVSGIAKRGGTDIGEFVGDLLILLWGMVSYTATWVYMSSGMDFFDVRGIGAIALELFAALLIFFIFFLPIQSVYMFEEAALPRNRRRSLFFWLGFTANVISAMLVLVSSSDKW